MMIERYLGYFMPTLPQGSKEKISRIGAIAKLDELVSATPIEQGRAFVIDCSAENMFSLSLGSQFLGMPRLGLGIIYSESKGKDLPELYRDLQKVNLPQKVVDASLEYHPWELGMPTEQVRFKLSIDAHHLWFPMHCSFDNNYEKMTEQRNEVSVVCIGNLSEKKQAAIKKLCEKKGAEVKIYLSTPDASTCDARKPNSFSRTTHYKTHHLGMAAPEVEVVVSWTGPDFDKKAIYFYGEIRHQLLPTHREEVSRWTRNMLRQTWPLGPKEGVSLNQERTGHYRLLASNMHCNMECRVPFTHEGENKVGTLHYYNFLGK